MSMAVQTTYGEPKRGLPGMLADRSIYEMVSRRNSEASGTLMFGFGVVQGTEPGNDIALPSAGATASKFEGVVAYSSNVEMNDDGTVFLEQNRILDILQSGKVWVQVTDDAVPTYGSAVYLVITGTDAGKFTTTESSNVKIKAKWLGEAEDGIAPCQLYDMPQV